MSGDLFCHSASLIIKNYEKDWAWFPITYVYNGDPYQGMFATYSKKLISKEHLENMVYILGFDSVEEFKEQYKSIEEMLKEGKLQEYRYNSAFETASIFWNYTKSEELGIRN